MDPAPAIQRTLEDSRNAPGIKEKSVFLADVDSAGILSAVSVF